MSATDAPMAMPTLPTDSATADTAAEAPLATVAGCPVSATAAAAAGGDAWLGGCNTTAPLASNAVISALSSPANINKVQGAWVST